MPEVYQAERTNDHQGLAIASLTLGILSIVTALIFYISILLGILAIIFGAVSLKGIGRKMSVAGIVTGIIGILVSIFVVAFIFMGIPALQNNQRDTARKNDISNLNVSVSSYESANQGLLPTAKDLPVSNLDQVTSVVDSGSPTKEKAVYKAGENCDGVASEHAYSISILLEDNSVYCQGS